MRALAVVVLITLAGGSGHAQSAPTTTMLAPHPEPLAPGAAEKIYAHDRKSPALAVTLETLCPIAGAGSLYVGREGDKAGFLAVMSGVAGGGGAGSGVWLSLPPNP